MTTRDSPPIAKARAGRECGRMTEMRPSAGRKVAGFSLLALGAIGTVLPVLQGGLFLALGLFVLRHQYTWAHRGMGWLERRWPGAVSRVERMEASLILRSKAAGREIRRLFGRG